MNSVNPAASWQDSCWKTLPEMRHLEGEMDATSLPVAETSSYCGGTLSGGTGCGPSSGSTGLRLVLSACTDTVARLSTGILLRSDGSFLQCGALVVACV